MTFIVRIELLSGVEELYKETNYDVIEKLRMLERDKVLFF